jgi:hypothetical protein
MEGRLSAAQPIPAPQFAEQHFVRKGLQAGYRVRRIVAPQPFEALISEPLATQQLAIAHVAKLVECPSRIYDHVANARGDFFTHVHGPTSLFGFIRSAKQLCRWQTQR